MKTARMVMDIHQRHQASARRRIFIEGVRPEIDCGAWPAKRIVGENMSIEVDLVCDGHDVVTGAVCYRRRGGEWAESALVDRGNDHYQGHFAVDEVGTWEYTVVAWVDHFSTWCRDLKKKVDAAVDIKVDLLIGADLVAGAAERAAGRDRQALEKAAKALANKRARPQTRSRMALDPELGALASRYADRSQQTEYQRVLRVTVHRPRARFSSWYEFFPRSCGEAGRHGTLKDATAHLDYVADMGFDIVYLPPIHPIGTSHRKGPNNTLEAGPGDPGSPWAIGAAAGGHTSIHPELGTLADFRVFRERAEALGMEVALDIAFQASPDHPWVKEHPDWFKSRPDGTIQYAENPPKKYQDIYPINFDSDDWRGLWSELHGVFEYWIGQGVKVFRVDNPHTKSLRFWHWCLEEIYAAHPDVLFLAEAFTKPRVMYGLAKLGFTQSYTYFTWRDSKDELTDYMMELCRPPVSDFFCPNFWPNTPDILPDHLQHGGRAAFVGRLILASTLSSSYGIYGPAYELLDHLPREGSGEYLDNEKYQLKSWDLERKDSLRHLIRRLNRIRRDNSALHDNSSLHFHNVDNSKIIAYSKRCGDNVILVVLNLDWYEPQSSTVHLDLGALGVSSPERPFEVHDLISDARYQWRGHHNYVALNPALLPAHVFTVNSSVK